MKSSNWILYNKKRNIKEISQKFGITPLTSVILCNRDIFDDSDIEKILSSNLSDMNEARLLPDVDMAIKIIKESIDGKKNIRIVGDYDIDGVCATYILYDSIKRLGGIVSYHIPDRFLDGYGINRNIIDKAIADKIDLIITCDNGIAASDEISYATSNGIKVLVTDHHDIGNLPDKAVAIVNPKRTDVKNKYPFDGICGAMVAYKVMERYFDVYEEDKEYVKNNYLEFTTIATIGDIMPLINENHIVAKVGLRKIVLTKNKGLKKLIEVAGIDSNNALTTYHIGFIIGPLINAAGRMENATLALELFLATDDDTISNLALTLKRLNDERKEMTENGAKLAVEIIEKKYVDDKVLVVFVENLGEQVAGIVAGRIKEKYNKPTIILTDTIEKDEAKASCRSIDTYDIFTALNAHRDILLKFGGHKLAAGFSIKKENIDMLRKLLNEKCELGDEDFAKKVYIDADFPFYEMNEDVINDIEKLAPFGQNFNKPTFASKSVETKILNVYGNSQNVVKLLFDKDGRDVKGVAFMDYKMIKDRLDKDTKIDIVYYPKVNEYRDIRNVEINLVDFR